MNYQLLGKSGLRVSELCLGTMTFGEEWGWGAGEDEARSIFDAFVEAGGNFIDTADGYTNGTSEKMVGEFIRAERGRFVVATKYSFNQRRGDPNAGGNHRKNMAQALEGSLRRLGTDYLDLYWMHAWDELTPIAEVMRAFDDFVRAGKVLYAGISDAPAWWVARANTIAELRGWTPFADLQFKDNLNCLKWSLNAKQMAQLDEVSRIEPGFPTDFLERPFVRDYLHGGLYDRITR